jgi:hypothetical protein
MANVKKGQVTATKEWRKHLRWWKRIFWKAERKAVKKLASENTSDGL